MKKHKFLLVSLCLLLILVAQPQNFTFLQNLFTHQNLASQLNLSDSSEEKKSDSEGVYQRQNEDLKSKVFDGQNQVLVVNEVAQFTIEDLSLENGSWEKYSDLDSLNRVGTAEAMLGQELIPISDREDVSSVIPTGWKNKRIVFNGKQDYLYNRSHLIGFQLSAENANMRNLFTGTRALNANFEDEKSSMVYYENSIANYIKETGHHVRYRVTPLFKNEELVARGVRMEAQSVEDGGLSFDIYIFNIQPGYEINYLTGTSKKL